MYTQTTGVAQINVADNGDNQIVIVTGANDKLSIEDVNEAKEMIDNAKVNKYQLYIYVFVVVTFVICLRARAFVYDRNFYLCCILK